MREPLGRKLLKEGAITEEQLLRAVQRQSLQGGRLGHNLVVLGVMKEEDLDKFFRRDPSPPATVEDTGLELSFIADLILKQFSFAGKFKLSDASDGVKLPLHITDEAVEELRRERSVEVKGATGYSKATYSFMITEQGRKRASELLEICRYTGPAPVTVQAYNSMVEVQTIRHIVVSEKSVREAFADVVISEKQLRSIGPAISSGRAIFLYGPPGNGKTTIAETMGKVLPESVYVPYSVIVGGQIISVFDPVNHIAAAEVKDDFDRRWAYVKRPVVMTGGELTMRMLGLEFNQVTKFYDAPLQMKANNGLFIVDDFGRQLVDPRSLLNRWIVPLERRTDFLTLNTGIKFEIPFDQLVVFSTNIEPDQLVDEAFLRRIRYKIKVDHPSYDEYREIFRKVCEANSIEYNEDVVEYLLNNFYKRLGVKLNACHPRDLMEHIIDMAHYFNCAPTLTIGVISEAWANYFVRI